MSLSVCAKLDCDFDTNIRDGADIERVGGRARVATYQEMVADG